MQDGGSGDPSGAEVLEQLKRILASQFRGAATQGRLLQFVVEKNLAGEAIQEVHIGDAIFENYNPDSHKVRSNATIVRQKVETFYENEGKNDTVRIRLLPGPNYKIEARYNRTAYAMRVYERAVSYSQLGTSRARYFAMSGFTEVIEAVPHFIPAYIGRLEVKLEGFAMQSLLPNQLTEDRSGEEVWQLAGALTERFPQCWFAYVVRGAMGLLYGEWRDAGIEFKKAKELDPHAISVSSWYGAYLVAIGRVDEGLIVAEAGARSRPTDIPSHLAYAFLLYATRKFEKAKEALTEVAAFDELLTLRSLITQLIGLHDGNYDLAFGEFGGRLDKTGWDIDPDIFEGIYARKTYAYCGVMILGLVGSGGDHLVHGIMRRENRKGKWRQISASQRALAYIGMNKKDWALKTLKRAVLQEEDSDFRWKNWDIAIPWLHLLPIFDPLREYGEFQEILQTIAKRGEIADAE